MQHLKKTLIKIENKSI